MLEIKAVFTKIAMSTLLTDQFSNYLSTMLSSYFVCSKSIFFSATLICYKCTIQ